MGILNDEVCGPEFANWGASRQGSWAGPLAFLKPFLTVLSLNHHGLGAFISRRASERRRSESTKFNGFSASVSGSRDRAPRFLSGRLSGVLSIKALSLFNLVIRTDTK